MASNYIPQIDARQLPDQKPTVEMLRQIGAIGDSAGKALALWEVHEEEKSNQDNAMRFISLINGSQSGLGLCSFVSNDNGIEKVPTIYDPYPRAGKPKLLFMYTGQQYPNACVYQLMVGDMKTNDPNNKFFLRGSVQEIMEVYRNVIAHTNAPDAYILRHYFPTAISLCSDTEYTLLRESGINQVGNAYYNYM